MVVCMDELLTIDNIENVLRREFSDCDIHIKQLIEELIEYTRENENDDLKKYIVDLCLLKKMGYIDFIYNDKKNPEKSSCYFSPYESAIVLGKIDDDLDDKVSLFSFIHETTHALHKIGFLDEVPEEFKKVKESFSKEENEPVHIFLAGYIHSISTGMLSLIQWGLLDRESLEKNNNIIEMSNSFEDIYDALLNGRLRDGIDITLPPYNDFFRLSPQEIIEMYNRVYNPNGLCDLNDTVVDYYDDVITTDGHGSAYYRGKSDDVAFMEILANYMSIKLVSNGVGEEHREMILNALHIVFGDMLEKCSKDFINGLFNFASTQIKYMLCDEHLDGEKLINELDGEVKNGTPTELSPLLLAFVSEEQKNDKEFMLKFLDIVRAYPNAKNNITRMISKELCSDLDFLKQTADYHYEAITLANRGNIPKKEYTELASYITNMNYTGFKDIDIDRLENGLEDYEKLALKIVKQGFGFVAINREELLEHDGGKELYKKLAIEACKNRCSLLYLRASNFKGLDDDDFYYKLAMLRIAEKPFEIMYCSFNDLNDTQAEMVAKTAHDAIVEKVEDVRHLSEDQLRTVGLIYGKMGVFNIKDVDSLNEEQLSIIRDKLTEDIRIHKEKKKASETGKTFN